MSSTNEKLKYYNSLEIVDRGFVDPDRLKVGSKREINDFLPPSVESSDKRWRVDMTDKRNREGLVQSRTGMFGSVFCADDAVLQKKVAIKIANEKIDGVDHVRRISSDTARFGIELNEKVDVISTFLLEARVLARIRHPNICEVYAFTVTENENGVQLPVIVMEWLEGEKLEDLFLDPDERKLNILEQVASGVDEIHKNGLVHYDIKPRSIIVSKEGVAKIFDFGSWQLSKYSNSNFITPAWTSPECAQMHPPTKYDDIWGYSATMITCFFDCSPFKDELAPVDTIRNVLERNINEALIGERRLSSWQSKYPGISRQNVIELFDKLFAQKISDRPQSANEAFDIMKDWIKKIS